MGVYIKGMEMSKSCPSCPFNSRAWYEESHLCLAKNEQIKVNLNTGFDDNCPLVNVPPHGRLGDIDKLIERLERQVDLHEKQAKRAEGKGTAGYTNDMYIVDRNRDLIGILKALSAVIPAEETEKAEKADTKIVYCKECQLVHDCPIQKKKDENEGNPFKEIIGCSEKVSVEK